MPGLASGAEALWYDPVRRPSWVDGLAHVAQVADGWPAEGHMIWTSRPGGRGRVLEEVRAYEARTGQTVAVEDERLRGTQRVSFRPGPEHVTVTLELDYELKDRPPLGALQDRLFVRPSVLASLRRTLEQFARERRAELEWDPSESR